MTFCTDVWEATAATRSAIDELPFVRGLGDGSLDRDRFRYYLTQDALYLRGYARALALAASRAHDAADIAFFARSAHTAITVERSLHEGEVGDIVDAHPSPTCTSYVSYLISLAQTQGYPELATGVLPCFWIYADVGQRLLDKAGDLAVHPYGQWIGTYADESFVASAEQAKAIVDHQAEHADPATVERMREAFTTATTYEWRFWDAAWRMEQWPFAGAAGAG